MHSGGSVRAGLIFANLCSTQPTIPVRGRSVPDVLRGLGRNPGTIRRPRRLVTARMMPMPALRVVSPFWDPAAIDVHDHPILQAAALGMAESQLASWRTKDAFRAHVDAFPVLIAQTESFADLAQLPSDRTLIVPNGTDPARFRWVPPPQTPVVGLVSGADPGRGIENLIEAVRQARADVPDLRLRMALAATSAPSRSYLEELRASCAGDRWIDIVSLAYDEVPAFLAATSIVAVPHPPGEYMDAILPVKLLDSMMSGRPLVVTPRIETKRIVQHHEAGEVASGDMPADMAAAIVRLAGDPDRSARLGQNGRAAAGQHYDWSILSERITRRLTGVNPDVASSLPDRRS
jgi:glycosyltransferase involved in cell wall biosynthesis